MKIVEAPGATPLDDESLKGLIPGLTTQKELDEFEQGNIARALLWADKSRTLKRDLLSVSGLILLHTKMFEDVWTWAGEFRQRQTNIGVSPRVIQNDLAVLLGDVDYWVKNKIYPIEEIAIRFHHRLVWIHPFPNGNGRFSRLATDMFLKYQGHPVFTWGSANLASIGSIRKQYIDALKKADKEDSYIELLRFAKG